MAAPKTSGMLMGRLTEMVVTAQGRKKIIRPSARFVAWIPKGKHLAIIKAAKNPPKAGVVSNSVKRIHKKFHNTQSNKSIVYEWPDVEGKLTEVGRMISLTYVVPDSIRSPDKRGYRWHHEFGDHGERGHGDVDESGNYPQKYMPLLLTDAKGNYYIKRKAGNKYYVTDWLYW